jgi:putative iron-regulated protein
MKRKLITITVAAIIIAGCKKENTTAVTDDFTILKSKGITDFVNVVALPGYAELKAKAAMLNDAVVALNASATEANLMAAKNAWKDLRSTWEKCEGYLFGPVDADEHDPETDTWPVNFIDLEALLADNTHPLTVADIESLTNRALKGYHPIEYVLWGKKTSPQTAATLAANSRQQLYIVSLTAALKNQADALYNSWIAGGGNYSNVFLTAGMAGNTTYPKKQDAYITLLEGCVGICGEVADGKMKDPFDAEAATPGSGGELVESPFSGNSVTDFKNNITGAYNVYLGKFNEQGKGISDLVKTKNVSLDNLIKTKFESAIGSFNNITVPYEDAIVSQRLQCQNSMAAIAALSELLDTQLRSFIITNITD